MTRTGHYIVSSAIGLTGVALSFWPLLVGGALYLFAAFLLMEPD